MKTALTPSWNRGGFRYFRQLLFSNFKVAERIVNTFQNQVVARSARGRSQLIEIPDGFIWDSDRDHTALSDRRFARMHNEFCSFAHGLVSPTCIYNIGFDVIFIYYIYVLHFVVYRCVTMW